MPAYLRLLIKERLTAFHPLASQKAGQSKTRTVLTFLGFALIFLTLYGMLVAFEYFVFRGFVMMGEPQGMLAVVFLLCSLLTLLMSFFYVFGTLFFSRDIPFVSALPIPSRGLLFSKLMMIVLEEALLALLICLPPVVLYGLETGAGVWLYAKLILFVPFLPALPIAIVTALSFGLIRVSALWKRREGVTTVAAFLLVAGIVAAQMRFSMSMSDAAMAQLFSRLIFQQRHLVDLFVRGFPPIRWICDAFLRSGAQGWLSGALFAGVSALGAMLVVWLLGGGYQALAVRQHEVVARLNAQGKRRGGKEGRRSPLLALYRQEMLEIITVPAYATNCLAPLVMFPIMAAVMAANAGNALEGLPVLRVLLQSVPRPLVLAIMAAFLCLTCTMNIAVSTAVSREGKRRYVSKIIPVAPQTQLWAKLLMGLTLNGIATLLTAAVFAVALPVFWLEILAGCVVAAAFSLLVCAGGLILDVYYPRLGWKTETEAVKRNTNGVLTMLGAVLGLGALVAAFWGLIALGARAEWALAALLLLLAGLDALLVRWLMGKASVTYFLQEKFS